MIVVCTSSGFKQTNWKSYIKICGYIPFWGKKRQNCSNFRSFLQDCSYFPLFFFFSCRLHLWFPPALKCSFHSLDWYLCSQVRGRLEPTLSFCHLTEPISPWAAQTISVVIHSFKKKAETPGCKQPEPAGAQPYSESRYQHRWLKIASLLASSSACSPAEVHSAVLHTAERGEGNWGARKRSRGREDPGLLWDWGLRPMQSCPTIWGGFAGRSAEISQVTR